MHGTSAQALVGLCLRRAGLAAEAITYVAVHGTGTPLGDPIEVGALGAALAPAQHSHLTLASTKVHLLSGLADLPLKMRHSIHQDCPTQCECSVGVLRPH